MTIPNPNSIPLIIYTDGACKGNPGVGGWAAVLLYKEHIKEIYGAIPYTTNNRMELTAVIAALITIKHNNCPVIVYTDSQYVQRGITEWLPNWLKKKWQGVKNPDLWQQLVSLTQSYQIQYRWVRGHMGDRYNERADLLANLAIANFMNKIS